MIFSPTFKFKIELVYQYPNQETGKREKELKGVCNFIKTQDIYYEQYNAGTRGDPTYTAPKGFTPMVYAVEGSLDLGKIVNLPKINSLLVGTENIPYNDNDYLSLRVTVTTEILSADGSSTIPADLNPIDYPGISWPSSSTTPAANTPVGILGIATVADTVDGPKEFRPADRLE